MSVRILPPELQSVAENELNEKPREVQENIRIIKEWILQQPHLHGCTADQWILRYLRGCKHNLQKVKQKIDFYYRLRSIAPEISANRDPTSQEFKQFLNAGIFVPLRTNFRGPQCFILRIGVDEADHIPFLSILKYSLMMMDVVANENDYMIMGQTFIYDLKGIRISKMFELSLQDMKKITSVRKAYASRIKNVIFLNVPKTVCSIIETMKVLTGKKIGDTMRICYEARLELNKDIPLSIIPQEYGGEEKLNKQIDYWKQKMEDTKEWFEKDALYGSDESKRVLTTFDEDLFGVDGSFRKLEID